MPYYIYRIRSTPVHQLEKLEQHDAFGAASARAKALRAEQGADAAARIKVIFAETELQAEDLLNTVRQAQVTGNDD